MPSISYEPNFNINEELKEKMSNTLGEEVTKKIEDLYYQL